MFRTRCTNDHEYYVYPALEYNIENIILNYCINLLVNATKMFFSSFFSFNDRYIAVHTY